MSGISTATAKQLIEEVRAFVGGQRAQSMVCPVLLDHVSKELEGVSAMKKNARKNARGVPLIEEGRGLRQTQQGGTMTSRELWSRPPRAARGGTEERRAEVTGSDFF